MCNVRCDSLKRDAGSQVPTDVTVGCFLSLQLLQKPAILGSHAGIYWPVDQKNNLLLSSPSSCICPHQPERTAVRHTWKSLGTNITSWGWPFLPPTARGARGSCSLGCSTCHNDISLSQLPPQPDCGFPGRKAGSALNGLICRRYIEMYAFHTTCKPASCETAPMPAVCMLISC